MTHIPDEAAVAATREYLDYLAAEGHRTNPVSGMRNALTAALPYLQTVVVAAVRKQALEDGFENGVEQSLDVLNAYDDIKRKEAEQAISKLKPDYRALSHELVSRSYFEKGYSGE